MVPRPRFVISLGLAAALTAALAIVACEDTATDIGGAAPPSPCTSIVSCQTRGSGSTTPLAPGSTVRFAYVTNTTDNTLSMFLVDAASGRLTPIGYVPVGAAPVAVVTDPASKFLYVANRDDDSIAAFTVEERTGTLLEIPGAPFATGAAPSALAVDPAGQFLFVSDRDAQDVRVYSIDATTGALALTDTESTGRASTSLAVYKPGATVYLYVGNENAGGAASITAFSLDSTTGTLSPIPDALSNTVAVGQGSIVLARHPTAAFLYAVTSEFGNVAVFSIDGSGVLTMDNASTASVGNGGSAVALTPSGGYAYVTNAINGTITDYTVTGTGLFSPIASSTDLATGTGPASIAVDPLEERVYITNAGSNDVSTLSISSTSGVLSAASTTRAQRAPRSLALVTRGVAATAKAKFAYILNQGASTVSSYDVDATSGVLTTNGAQSLTAGLGTSRAMAVDPFARFVYVAHASNVISAYRINGTNGKLPSIATVTSGAKESVSISVDPTALAIEPSGRFVYAAGSTPAGATGWQVVVLTIDQTTGELTELSGSGLDTGTLPTSIVSDPTGRFLYVVDSTSDDVSMFTINTATGLLTSVGAALSVDDDPRNLAVDGSGRFAYLVSAGTSRIQGFAINAATGGLTSIMSPLATGTNPQAVAADPTGRFVYAANADANNITPYRIGSMGELTAGTVSTTTGSSPTTVTAEPGGRFVYATNQVSNSLATYSINQTTGNLTRVGSASIPSGTLTTPIAVGLTLLIE